MLIVQNENDYYWSNGCFVSSSAGALFPCSNPKDLIVWNDNLYVLLEGKVIVLSLELIQKNEIILHNAIRFVVCRNSLLIVSFYGLHSICGEEILHFSQKAVDACFLTDLLYIAFDQEIFVWKPYGTLLTLFYQIEQQIERIFAFHSMFYESNVVSFSSDGIFYIVDEAFFPCSPCFVTSKFLIEFDCDFCKIFSHFGMFTDLFEAEDVAILRDQVYFMKNGKLFVWNEKEKSRLQLLNSLSDHLELLNEPSNDIQAKGSLAKFLHSHISDSPLIECFITPCNTNLIFVNVKLAQSFSFSVYVTLFNETNSATQKAHAVDERFSICADWTTISLPCMIIVELSITDFTFPIWSSTLNCTDFLLPSDDRISNLQKSFNIHFDRPLCDLLNILLFDGIIKYYLTNLK